MVKKISGVGDQKSDNRNLPEFVLLVSFIQKFSTCNYQNEGYRQKSYSGRHIDEQFDGRCFIYKKKLQFKSVSLKLKCNKNTDKYKNPNVYIYGRSLLTFVFVMLIFVWHWQRLGVWQRSTKIINMFFSKGPHSWKQLNL